MSQAGVIAVNSGSLAIETLTGNTGGAVSPDGSFNIDIFGSITTTVVGNLATHTLTITPTSAGYPITPYVVGPSGQAGYQTIQSAVNAANTAGGGLVYVQEGTYTENLTLFDKICIQGTNFVQTIITGVHTPPASGTLVFKNIQLTSATHIFSSAAAGTTRITLSEVDVRVTNGYCFNLLNWTGELDIFTSTSVAGGVNDGFLNNTGGSTVYVINSDVGAGTGNAAVMTGVNIQFVSASINCPATIGGAGSALFVESCEIYHTFTTAGSATTSIYSSLLSTGATPVISHGSSGILIINNSTITSSNNPSIAGAGAGVMTLGGIAFTNNSSVAGTLTLAAVPGFIAGTNTAYGVLCGGTVASAPIQSVASVGTSGQVLTSNGAGALPSFQNNTPISWTDVTGATQTLAVQNGYVTDRGGGVTYTLPATATLGQEILIVGKLGLTTVAQNANQQISISNSSSTVGVGGSVAGTNVGDCISLICITPGASTVWRANNLVGNWTVT